MSRWFWIVTAMAAFAALVLAGTSPDPAAAAWGPTTAPTEVGARAGGEPCDAGHELIGQPCDSPDDADTCASGLYECPLDTLTCTDDAVLDDADGDGVWDCDDTCDGDDALIGGPCDSPDDEDNCASGVYDCTSGTLVCTDDAALDDADGDGVWDCDDTCVGDDALIGEPCDSPADTDNCESGLYDCALGTLSCSDDAALDDDDGDGIWDCNDTCVGDESLVGEPCDSPVDVDECETGVFECSSGALSCTDDDELDDADGDGILDCNDTCDGDNALIGQPCDSPADADDCASAPYDCKSGTLTCTDDAALDDADGDGIWDCVDTCIGDDSLIDGPCDSPVDADNCESGLYDCALGTLSCSDDAAVDDEDGDGVWDCNDTCEGDNALIGQSCDSTVDTDPCESGVWDCSSETLSCTDDDALDDADGDGIVDCDDTCVGNDAEIGQPCDSPDDADDCFSGVQDCSSGQLLCTDDAALDDGDGDGIWDCVDPCIGDDTLIGSPCDGSEDEDDCESGVFECDSGTLTCTDDALLDDEDTDGVWDCNDACPGTASADPVDADGCSCDQLGLSDTDDEDDDGVADCFDDCPGTEVDEPVAATGCSCAQLPAVRMVVEDTDADTVPDGCDNCPETPNTDQADSDGDGIGDECDGCDGDDSLIDQPCDSPIDKDDCPTGVYECSSGTLLCSDDDETDDLDGDGVCDGEDICPGFDDGVDTDSDTLPDGCDNCPDHANADQADCDLDGTGDICAIASGLSADCNTNGLPDNCELGQQAKLLASDAAASDWFGKSVSLSGDTAVAGAYQADCGTTIGCGAAYVYRFDGTAWIEEAKLIASDSALTDWFGFSVSISGNTIVVGAFKRDCTPPGGTVLDDCGAVYVFEYDGEQWSEEAKLTASDPTALDMFGYSVSVSGDTIAVGERLADCKSGDDCGAAYVFEKPVDGWIDMTETAKLTASDAAATDWFGNAISVSGDTIVVGARLADCGAGINCGAAYLFEKPVTGWVDMNQTAKLISSDATESDELGVSVSVSGGTAVVGASSDDCTAFVFEKPGLEWVDMTETARLMPSVVVGSPGFGASVSVSGDTTIVGAPAEDCAGGTGCGAVYVFEKSKSGWTDMAETARLTASDVADGDSFGVSVSVGLDIAIVGAQLDDCSAGIECGSAYLFSIGDFDCNSNGALDHCDISSGTSTDCNGNSVPDDCEPDADGDGVIDGCDTCEGDDTLIGQPCDSVIDADDCASGEQDCTSGTLICTDDDALDDEDGDSIWDCNDTCIGDVAVIGQPCDSPDDEDDCASGVYDCASGTLTCSDDAALDDADGDLVWDCIDTCIGDNTLIGLPCDGDDGDDCASGVYDCSTKTLLCTDDAAVDDEDDDGVNDCDDLCPATPAGFVVDADGCAVDGACCLAVGICIDHANHDDCVAFAGLYLGNGLSCDGDPDGDGSVGCEDSCPWDENKTEPGVCGCGQPDDADDDGDAVPNCVDLCPKTPPSLPVDANGCAAIGACCSASGGCFDNVDQVTCDSIQGTYQGDRTSCEGGCVFGDFDLDGDADLRDVSSFSSCFTGPDAGPLPPECLQGDFDADGDIDLDDAKWFMSSVRGP